MPKKTGLGKGLGSLFEINAPEEPSSEQSRLLRLSAIEPNKNQPRKAFSEEALSELADSIKEHGLIQPLLVRPIGDDRYQLVAGERRWRACRMLGLDEVPATVREMTDAEVMELALIENLQREDLTPLEEAAGYRDLMETYGLTQEDAAKRVGKSRSAVANTLRLLQLPEQVRLLVEEGRLSAGHARALMGISDVAAMTAVAKEAADKGLSVREVEKRAAREKAEKKDPKGFATFDSYLLMMEKALEEELGRKVKLTVGKSGKGTLTIHFYNKEDLTAIAEKLTK